MRHRPVLVVLCCLCVAAPVVAATAPPGSAAATSAAPDDPANPCVGTMSSPAEGITVVSVQGMRFGDDGGKRTARLVALGPRGQIEWVHQRDGVTWSYDVDPLEDGTLFVTATQSRPGDKPGQTLFYKLDPETGETVWSETAPFVDTHDADLLSDEEILVANMRATQNVSGNRDRLLVYNRTSDEITWQWQFRDHYDRDADIGGNYSHDWTHVNDVDAVNDTHYLASPRNFDMVVMVNRTSGEVEWELGEPNSDDVMLKQHNPVYYESENGTPTVLVADSENNRVVEYARRDGDWERTWRVGNRSSLSWPRDADRLPNGNTLVGDSSNNRVLEVTPEGEVVWEVYTPWLVYDVERVEYGDEAGGPTIADQNATGNATLHGDADFDATRQEECVAHIENATAFEDLGDDGDGGIVGDLFGGNDDGSDGTDGAGDDSEDGSDSGVGSDALGPVPFVGAVLAILAVAAGIAYRRRGA
ncbi:PGF-CTERM sorting domain-containing protein [Halorubellus sp. JP-L1]|uniref:aryl-sulfate sulfotransferase n=1 Tax=Halorubellus sp. JP-L1 TaxID=2715753 RepID=UPI00140E21FC|nr:aryl-sulfate sulfotransferase [Halorubellus sp. JP-L1]NHN42030.1 PGF-CTERM sorting domain-containing protein [Halorubellus sp. JP-L1]